MTKTIRTSILSEEEMAEATTEAAAAIEANAARVGQIKIVSKTHRQQEVALKSQNLRLLPSQDCVVGTGCSAIRVASASPTVHASSLSLPLSSRETAKGADDSEFGDPHFYIHKLKK